MQPRAVVADQRSDRAVLVVAGLVVCAGLIVLFGVLLARSIAAPACVRRRGRPGSPAATCRCASRGRARRGRRTRRAPSTRWPRRSRRAARSSRSRTSALAQRAAEVRARQHRLARGADAARERARLHVAAAPPRRRPGTRRRDYLEIIDAQAAGSPRSSTTSWTCSGSRRVGSTSTGTVDLRALLGEQAALRGAEPEPHAIELGARPSLPVRGDGTGSPRSSATSSRTRSSTRRTAASRRARGERRARVRVDRQRRGPRDSGGPAGADLHQVLPRRRGASGIAGSGLGLAFSREIVEAHGGRMGFTSDPTGGIHLPGRAATERA